MLDLYGRRQYISLFVYDEREKTEMFGIGNLLLLLGSSGHVAGRVAKEKISVARHGDVERNAASFRIKLQASYDLRKAIEREYLDVYRYNKIWERIERYKRMNPDFCRNVTRKNAWFDWDKVGQTRLDISYKYKSKNERYLYENAMHRLLSMTCGKLSLGDVLDYAVPLSYPDHKNYNIAQYLYTHPIPQLSSSSDFIVERNAYEQEKMEWRNRYPQSKKTSLNPLYYGSENRFRRDVDKELRVMEILKDDG